MLTDKEFATWCKANEVSREAAMFIQRIRKSEPARRVASRKNNTIGVYPSRKMKFGVQFESGTGELSATYLLEHDPDVLEYYDQPSPKLTLKYLQNERKVSVQYTADHFILNKCGPEYIEWKYEEDLLKLSQEKPNRYYREPSGVWRCPPAEEFAAEWGITFTVRTYDELNTIYIRNLRFLEYYLVESSTRTSQIPNEEKILEIVRLNPGIRLSKLLDYVDSADDIYRLIVQDRVFVDLNKYTLAEYQFTPLYADIETSRAFEAMLTAPPSTHYANVNTAPILEPGQRILWDGRPYTLVHIGNSKVTLQDDVQILNIPTTDFENLTLQGLIKGLPAQFDDDVSRQEMSRIIAEASEVDLRTANEHFAAIEPLLYAKGPTSVDIPKRTLQDWLARYRDAEQVYGYGFVGLIPKNRSGNRTPRLDAEVERAMEWAIETVYKNPKQKTKSAVYGQLREYCKQNGIVSPSYPTFISRLNKHSTFEIVKSRKGPRAAYEFAVKYWSLNKDTPHHGDRPFECAHIDHTQIDLQTVSSQNGKGLGKPWLTIMFDAFDRRVLAHYLSYDEASAVSCMMVIRECVRRHNRLPEYLIVDNGKEFHSTYFDTLLNLYHVKKFHRPPHQSRYGSVIERMFGMTNTSFIYMLAGNTQITKTVRIMTKSFDPKQHSVWDLATLNIFMSKFFYELYDQKEHPKLGCSPREAFEAGVKNSGTRPMMNIAFDEAFHIMTLPAKKENGGTARVDPTRGFKLHYTWYWNEAFRHFHTKRDVPVRIDPFDIGHTYAYINGKWLECISEYHYILAGRSVKELGIITAELRRQKTNSNQAFNINAEKIAHFIQEAEETEELLRQRLKDTAVQDTFTDLLGGKGEANRKQATKPQAVSDARSLATLGTPEVF